MTTREVAIVGAGPIGLELAVALKRHGIDYWHLDAAQIGQVIYQFPPAMRFFSTAERLSLAGVPIPLTMDSRCTREEYLAYLRSVVKQFDLDVNTYERVTDIERNGETFHLHTKRTNGETCKYAARKLVLAVGGTARPRHLDVPGEKLPHVEHALGDVHAFFRRRVLVVGGKNSAVEAALRSYHAGAEVTISYRGDAFPDRVKYWLRPEINMLIDTGRIVSHFHTVPRAITTDCVTLESTEDGRTVDVPADHVLVMIGYHADMSLFRTVGVELKSARQLPVYDEATMETNVPGVFVAGTAVAGTQQRYVVFLENCHVHVDRIVAALTGNAPPPPVEPYKMPEA